MPIPGPACRAYDALCLGYGPGICILTHLSWVILMCSQIWEPKSPPSSSRENPFKVQALMDLEMEGRLGNTLGLADPWFYNSYTKVRNVTSSAHQIPEYRVLGKSQF